jgi:hypothetical protein
VRLVTYELDGAVGCGVLGAAGVVPIHGAPIQDRGDIVATGTPAGVGFSRGPPLLVAPDDLIEVTIEAVGRLANPVVAPAALRR